MNTHHKVTCYAGGFADLDDGALVHRFSGMKGRGREPRWGGWNGGGTSGSSWGSTDLSDEVIGIYGGWGYAVGFLRRRLLKTERMPRRGLFSCALLQQIEKTSAVVRSKRVSRIATSEIVKS